MPLPEDFPEKTLLEKEGYRTVEDVSEATDEELLAIGGIAEGKLAKIREEAPYTESSDESGTGATSGKTSDPKGTGPSTSIEPTSGSFEAQTSKKSKDQTDPVTGEKLPDGITKNERGTLTASSTVKQSDMVSPEQVIRERKSILRNQGEKIAALLEG